MDNIIQQLKKNKIVFGLMSEEMQEKARDIGITGNFYLFQHLCGTEKIWKFIRYDESCNSTNDLFVSGTTYRLRPDYKDEPEIVEYKITIGGCTAWMGKLVYTDERVLEQGICEACADPDFIGFKFESGQVELTPIVFKSDCSTKSICQFRDLADLEVLHASHVLFKRKKQE